MAGSKNKFSDPLKRKGKSPESKEKAPILKIAYSDTVIPRIPVSSRSHWSSKISNFSKSIKPACAKTNTKCKTNWLFPSRVYTKGLQKCIASRKKERDLKKKSIPYTDRGGRRTEIHYIFKPLTHWFLLLPPTPNPIVKFRQTEAQRNTQAFRAWGFGLGYCWLRRKRHQTHTLQHELCHHSTLETIRTRL